MPKAFEEEAQTVQSARQLKQKWLRGDSDNNKPDNKPDDNGPHGSKIGKDLGNVNNFCIDEHGHIHELTFPPAPTPPKDDPKEDPEWENDEAEYTDAENAESD